MKNCVVDLIATPLPSCSAGSLEISHCSKPSYVITSAWYKHSKIWCKSSVMDNWFLLICNVPVRLELTSIVVLTYFNFYLMSLTVGMFQFVYQCLKGIKCLRLPFHFSIQYPFEDHSPVWECLSVERATVRLINSYTLNNNIILYLYRLVSYNLTFFTKIIAL